MGIFDVPSHKYEDWHLLAAVPSDWPAGALALITLIAIGVMAKLTAPLARWTILRAAIGGVIFGLVGVALPLTLFTGTGQLPTVIRDGATLGAGLLIVAVFAKMLVFGLCKDHRLHRRSHPRRTVHRRHGRDRHARADPRPARGARVHNDVRRRPRSTSRVAAPLSLIVLTALTTRIGALQTAPVAIAVLTAYLAVSGTGTLAALANRARKSARPGTKQA